MRVSEIIAISSLFACVLGSTMIIEAERRITEMGLLYTQNLRIIPFTLLLISGFAALYSGLAGTDQFSVYTIKCLRCQKEYSSRSSLKTELWYLQHRLRAHTRARAEEDEEK